jgi:hypothetical protein
MAHVRLLVSSSTRSALAKALETDHDALGRRHAATSLSGSSSPGAASVGGRGMLLRASGLAIDPRARFGVVDQGWHTLSWQLQLQQSMLPPHAAPGEKQVGVGQVGIVSHVPIGPHCRPGQHGAALPAQLEPAGLQPALPPLPPLPLPPLPPLPAALHAARASLCSVQLTSSGSPAAVHT